MDDAGFIIASYLLTFGGIALLTLRNVRRARKLAQQLPAEDLPWT
jgi:hypothetical protein